MLIFIFLIRIPAQDLNLVKHLDVQVETREDHSNCKVLYSTMLQLGGRIFQIALFLQLRVIEIKFIVAALSVCPLVWQITSKLLLAFE